MSLSRSDVGLTRLVTAFAAAASLVLAVAVPATYFWAAHARETARAHALGRSAAGEVSDMVSRNPDFWRFERARVVAVFARHQTAESPAHHRLLDAAGALVAEHPVAVAAPSFEVSDPVFDAGRAVGEVRTTRSLEGVVRETAAAAVAAAALALAAFLALRTLPLRALRRALERASRLAHFDTLTGLPNRALFHDRLREAAALAREGKGAVAVLCLDLDRFKDVNDTLGHAAGDLLLGQVAARLRAAARETDTVARLGGDEFAVLQIRAGTGGPDGAEELARRLVEAMARPFDLDGHRAVVGTSVGIALAAGPGGADPARLLREADLALYQAKGEGRGAYRFFEPGMNERLLARKRLEEDLREALDAGHFRLHYQPQVQVRPGSDGEAVVGAEALIRWRHPSRGEVRPDQFIPLAEETGLIVPLGDWTLREACRRAAGWPAGLQVAVNVSPVQFRHPGLVASVAAALRESGLAPGRLELEVTEGVLLTDTAETLATLDRLRGLGVKLAMDDFGTGFSSLGYLRRFRFDKIKIDRSFVRHLGEDADAEAIVRAVVGMGRAMRMGVNAEGVESRMQAELLRTEGCGEMQGYLFGRPVPPEEFEAALEAAPAASFLPAA